MGTETPNLHSISVRINILSVYERDYEYFIYNQKKGKMMDTLEKFHINKTPWP